MYNKRVQPSDYPHLHRNLYKENIEISIDGLIGTLLELSIGRPEEDVKICETFIEDLLTFRDRLPKLRDDFNLITDNSATVLNIINQLIYYGKERDKINIASRGIRTLREDSESITTQKITNTDGDQVKILDDITDDFDKEYHAFLLCNNLEYGKGLEYIKQIRDKDDVWNDITAKAEQVGYFTKSEKNLATRWNSCLVGKLFQIPKLDKPIHEGDYIEYCYGRFLIILGSEFAEAVRNDYIKSARTIHDQIKEIRYHTLLV